MKFNEYPVATSSDVSDTVLFWNQSVAKVNQISLDNLGNLVLEKLPTELSTPPAIGGTTPSDGAFNKLSGTVKALGTGAVERSLQSRASDVFNVKDFNAKGDGSTDDTAAIQAAVTAAKTAGRGIVYFPQGDYAITDAIAMSGAASISILGAGKRISRLIQKTSAKNGFTFAFTGISDQYSAYNTVDIKDIGFIAKADGCGKAISISYPPIGSDEFTDGSTVENVYIGTDDLSSTNGWSTGIYLNNAWHFKISNSFMFGSVTGYTTDGTGSGGGSAIHINGGVNGSIQSVDTNFFYRGIKIEATASETDTVQGIDISDWKGVEMFEAIHVYGVISPANYIGFINITNSVIDNGNIAVTGRTTAIFDNVNSVYIDNTSILQNVEANIVVFNNCNQSGVQNSMIFGPCTHGIYCKNGSNGISITGVGFRGQTYGVYADDTTYNIKANTNNAYEGNLVNLDELESIDGEATNQIGDNVGFTTVQNVTAGNPVTWTFSLDITNCCLGKKPDGICVDCTSDPEVGAQYDFSNAGNSAQVAFFKVYKYRSGTFTTGDPFRFSIRVGP